MTRRTMAEQFIHDCREAGEEWCSWCSANGSMRALAEEPARIFCLSCGRTAVVSTDGVHLVAVWDTQAEA